MNFQCIKWAEKQPLVNNASHWASAFPLGIQDADSLMWFSYNHSHYNYAFVTWFPSQFCGIQGSSGEIGDGPQTLVYLDCLSIMAVITRAHSKG